MVRAVYCQVVVFFDRYNQAKTVSVVDLVATVDCFRFSTTCQTLPGENDCVARQNV